MRRVWTQCDRAGHKILSSLTLRPGPTSAAAAAAAMLNNLAVSAGGLNLGGEMGHKKEGGRVPRHQVCKFPLIVWVYGEIDTFSVCLSPSLGAPLLIGEQRD